MERQANSSTHNNARKWQGIQILGAECIISTSVMNNSWKISISNLVEIWTETITKDTALARCQSLNMLLDLDSFDIDKTLDAMLNDIPKYATDRSLHEIKLENCIDGVMFKFTINLSKGSPQQLWNEITKPLCQSSMELHRRHQVLLDLIKKKDEELSEYRLSGAQLTRKNIATLPYNEDTFKNHISLGNSKSDCLATFQSMMDFYSELKKCESSLNNVPEHFPQESNDPNQADSRRIPKRENMESSEMTTVVDRIKIETRTEDSPIRESDSIAPEIEVIEECGDNQSKPTVSESNASLRTTKVKKKKSISNVANVPLSSIEQPSQKPKRHRATPNIYDFIA